MSGQNPIHPLLAPLAQAAKEMTRARNAQSASRLDDALRQALRRQKSWLRPEHRVGDPLGYMRHLIFTDAQSDFVMTVITWLPGQRSPVHGHQVWCAYGVVEGVLTEEQFSVATGQPPQVVRTNVYQPGEPAEQDLEGAVVHRVSNQSDGTLVSLHLYGVAADRLTTGINRVYG